MNKGENNPSYKHGYAMRNNHHPLYDIWLHMKQRCYDKNSTRYDYWGGKGITVCDEWRTTPKPFIEWALGNGWRKGLHLDRINNEGDYEPSNCRFVTNRENSLNKRFLTSRNKSGYRGVSWYKPTKKWVSQIQINGKGKTIGYFNSREEAAEAYNRIAKKHNYKLNKIYPFIG